MRLVFIDETSDEKLRDYLGFSICTVDSRFYPAIKAEAQKILRSVEWNAQVEFKGSYLFSASKGCTDVQVEQRIKAAHRLLDLHIAQANRRMQFHFGRMASKDHRTAYLTDLPGLLAKVLPQAPTGGGKNLLSITCDQRSDISADEVHAALLPAANSRGYVLLERVVVARSSFDTIGLMFSDLVGYLIARVETISSDSGLFEGLTAEQLEHNGKIRKLRSSKELISKIRKLQVYGPAAKPAKAT